MSSFRHPSKLIHTENETEKEKGCAIHPGRAFRRARAAHAPDTAPRVGAPPKKPEKEKEPNQHRKSSFPIFEVQHKFVYFHNGVRASHVILNRGHYVHSEARWRQILAENDTSPEITEVPRNK